MKEKIKKYWWAIIVILVIGGAFYWYEWRPSQIIKECSKELKRTGSIEVRELFYETCLTKKGLKK